MRRAAFATVAALTFGDAILRGMMLLGFFLLLAFIVLGIRLQWKVTKKVESYVPPVIEPDPDLLAWATIPGDAAASSVYVGLMQDDQPTGPRKKARVLLDGSVRFLKPVILPMPPAGYDEVAVWADDQSFGGQPLVRLSPWLCAEETADGNVAIGNFTT